MKYSKSTLNAILGSSKAVADPAYEWWGGIWGDIQKLGGALHFLYIIPIAGSVGF